VLEVGLREQRRRRGDAALVLCARELTEDQPALLIADAGGAAARREQNLLLGRPCHQGAPRSRSPAIARSVCSWVAESCHSTPIACGGTGTRSETGTMRVRAITHAAGCVSVRR